MFKRLLLIAPLGLMLAACGSSDNQAATPAAPASPTPTSETAPTAAEPTPTATPGATASAVGATTAPATTDASTGEAGAPDAGLSAADRAAMAKAAASFVDDGKWVEGTNYFVIEPQQPKVTNTPKIEVVEIFSWGCPSCNAAHPFIDKLRAELPSYATMAYLAAGFRPDENWTLYQRSWYAAKALGVARKSYAAMFDANWKTGETGSYNLATGQLNPRAQWPDINTIAKFFSDHYGVAPKQFVAVANSFAVNTQMKRANELIKDYKVPSTPTLVIDGRYRFSFVSAGGYPQGIALAKWLIAKDAKRLTAQSAAAQ